MPAVEDVKRIIIIEAATKVFAQKGYQYATISEIAREAGMATGLLYSYFQNKLDVLLSIVLRFLQTINAQNDKTLTPLQDAGDKLYVLLHNCEHILLIDESSLYLVKVLHDALPHVSVHKDLKLHDKQNMIISENQILVETIDAIITEGQRQGIFDDSLSCSVMRQIFSGAIERIFYGLYFQMVVGQKVGYDADEGQQAVRRLIETFIRR
ncbi:MAG: TetR/AcrR family transcriptional regulator [Deltaproteobacteria bacterium]|nr:TetR/AcrR family transcriptional regulator [Deltaproteobacteria bacterium]